VKERLPWVIAGIAIILMAVLGSIFAPAYKQKTKEVDSWKETSNCYQLKYQEQVAVNQRLRESLSKHSHIETVKEPVFNNGQVAYRETFIQTEDVDSAKESVSQSMSQAQHNQAAEANSYSQASIKETTTTKRAKFDVGIGYSTDQKVCGMLGYGSLLGVWIVGKSNMKSLTEGLGGVKLSF
jgi:hypothetical protein